MTPAAQGGCVENLIPSLRFRKAVSALLKLECKTFVTTKQWKRYHHFYM